MEEHSRVRIEDPEGGRSGTECVVTVLLYCGIHQRGARCI